MSLDAWKAIFDSENVMEVLVMERGHGQSWSMLGSHEMQGKLHHLPARCDACKAEVPVWELGDLARMGLHRCSCGKERTVREAPVWARAVFPGASWVVDEHLPGADDGTDGATTPVLFACMGCGGSLRVDGSSRTVRCEYCDDENFLPDALWQRLHPTPKIREFFVVVEIPDAVVAKARDADDDTRDHAAQLLRGTELPPELLARMVQSGDDELRQGAAASPSLSREDMARLARDEDYSVRAALATNPSVDRATLEALASDSDDDVRSAVAKRAGTPPELLAKLMQDNDWEVRRDAVRNLATPLAAIAARAAKERDNDVLGALAARPDLDTAVLAALAGNRDSDARAVAAAHPDTPPDALAVMAEDSYGEIGVLLAGHPSTPLSALKTLVEHDREEACVVLAARAGLPKGLLLQLGRSERAEVARAAQANPAWAPARKAAVRTKLLIAAGIVLLLMAAAAVFLVVAGLGVVLS